MSTNQTMGSDLTRGPVMSRLVRFTLPIMLANALQVAFNLVDMFFIGRYAGTDALSAVSIGGQLTNLTFSFFLGIATGGQICSSQAAGAGNRSGISRLIGNAVTLSLLVGAVLMLVIPFATPIMRLMNTPEVILSDTVTYVIVCAWVFIPVALYNALSGILRGLGDSKHPTLFVGIATVINIVLDYLFICVFRWGVFGAALATAIGQFSACAFSVAFLYRRKAEFGFDFRLKSLRFEKQTLLALLGMSVPIAIKQFFISGSLLFVNVLINALGVTAVAVIGISQKLQSIVQVVGFSMTDGTSSMVGQNFAAGNLARVRRTVWSAILLGCAYCAVISVFFLTIPEAIFSLFTKDPELIAMSPAFLQVCCLSMLSLVLMTPMIGLLNGVGNASLNLIISIADGVVARIALSLLLGRTLGMGALGFFLGNTLAGYVTVIWGGLYFLSGKWKNRSVIMSGAGAAAG